MNRPAGIPASWRPQAAPFSEEFFHLARKWSDMMDEMLNRDLVRFASQREWSPPINLYETPTAFLICAELGGMDPAHIDVSVQGRAVVIRGTRPDPHPPDEAGELCVHLLEINAGAFRRIVDMPANVDADRVEAAYRDGMLWITLPKAA